MKGITVPRFVGRFVDKSLAFATVYNYWYAYSIIVAAEFVAGGILLGYLAPNVNPAVWITIFLVSLLFLTIIAVASFGDVSSLS